MSTHAPNSSWRRFAVLLLGLATLVSASSEVSAQAARYELRQRLGALETSWATADGAAKLRALEPLEIAVTSFFKLRLEDAARELDRARLALRDPALAPRTTPVARAWAAALAVEPAWRFGATVADSEDAAGETLAFQVRRLYDSGAPRPSDASLRAGLWSEAGESLATAEPSAATDAELELAGTLPLAGVPAGDHRLVVQVFVGEHELQRIEVGVSLAEMPRTRVAAVERALARRDPGPPALERASAERLAQLLDDLLAGETPETDVPANALLRRAEEFAATGPDERALDHRHPGVEWLRVPVGRSGVDVRLFAPALAAATEADAAPLRPVVVVLHGAGGSDSMFFDTYGKGLAVHLAHARGWVLVSPRSTLFGGPKVRDLLDALTERYRLDPERVLILGHSMGAAQALAAARAAPERFRALASIGGGRPARGDARLVGLPLYVAAGSEDFALGNAQALVTALRELGATPSFEVRPGIEHLMIVQETLPTAFTFFDEALEKAREPR